MLTTDFLASVGWPHLTENEALRKLVKALDPRYDLPSVGKVHEKQILTYKTDPQVKYPAFDRFTTGDMLKSGISPLDLTALEDDEVPQTFWDVADIGVRYLDPKSLTPSDKLALYAYYKQGTCGDFTGSASALGSLLGNQESIKQMVWQNLKGMTRTEAQRKYLETYEQLYRKLHLEKELPEVQELLLSSIIPTRHRKEWETEGHEAQSLAHFGAELYTTVYPDQLPENLARDYASKVGMRYKRTMMNRYLVDLRAKRAAGPVSDTDFKRYTTQTAFSKLMRPLRELEEGAQKAYLALLEEAEGKRGLCNLEEDDIFLIDATGISVLPVREADGCFVGPSVIFLRSKKNTQDEEEGKGKTPQDPTPFAIALECTQHGTEYPPPASQRFPACLSNLRTVTPDQGLAWEMAKLFSLQAADYLQGLGFHVVLHVLTMNPVLLAFHRTVKELPEGGRMSALACMMGEHAFLALATNSFVFHSEYSVMWPDNKKQPYDAFCCRCDDLPPGEFDHLGGAFHLARLAFEGVEGHPVYRPADDLKQIQMEAYDRKGTGSYLWFLSRVRGAVLRFVASVFSEIEHREEDREFAVRLVENLRKTLPRGSSILKKLPQTDENDTAEECLKWAQTVLVYMVCHSVEHCLDHFLSDTMADATLGRIRAPIDFDNTTTDLRAIHTKVGGRTEKRLRVGMGRGRER
uniref:ACB domain-containing protein n=1 Tax=Chromera velia CCMP2878 TaxID=1169474 RepID=A0A0G4FK41_9ALVE|eukprot:Cvel_3425.t1-p1 / transcript=Cvel_3425.t1 / gene=Cvel_3425 / organism=Chromera_velia_CCMP2878 / gene_product=hypothetical protein / transcript_product=hypothetical protein / location=Cvel_scaffold138:271-6210(+) / protein_length=690 / sequence_SO=supercontig / SO=protein_coding / is_pseudo=false